MAAYAARASQNGSGDDPSIDLPEYVHEYRKALRGLADGGVTFPDATRPV